MMVSKDRELLKSHPNNKVLENRGGNFVVMNRHYTHTSPQHTLNIDYLFFPVVLTEYAFMNCSNSPDTLMGLCLELIITGMKREFMNPECFSSILSNES